MRAFVLAAGFGRRMEPLTGLLPKPLLPLGNLPNLLHILHYLRCQGVAEVIVNLHHHPQRIREALEGRDLGLKVRFSEEPELLGTAGGIKKAEASLRDGTFIVINADIALEFDLAPALAFHKEAGALATLILKEDKRAKALGTLGIDEEGGLCRFLKSEAPGSRGEPLREGLFTGLHILEPDILEEIPPGRNCGISDEVYPRLLTRGRPLFGYFTEGYWEDLGTPSGYLAAHRAFLEGRLRLPLWEKEGRGQLFPLDKEGAPPQVVPPVLLGEGVELRPGSRVGPFSSLGEGCRVEEGALAERSVLWEGVKVGKGVLLRDSIVAGVLRIDGARAIERKLIAPQPGGELELRAF